MYRREMCLLLLQCTCHTKHLKRCRPPIKFVCIVVETSRASIQACVRTSLSGLECFAVTVIAACHQCQQPSAKSSVAAAATALNVTALRI